MRFLTPRWLLSHLFVVAMLVVMVNLGFWQLRRLDDRMDRNDEIRSAMVRVPVAVEDLLDGDPAPEDHTATIVTGTYRPDLEFLVANRTFEGRPGFWLVTPIEIADGRIVAVSRGWVPRPWVVGVDERDASAPAGTVVVEGRAFGSVGGGRIAVTALGETLEISRMDLGRVDELLDVDVADRWVQLVSQDPSRGEIPIPVPPPGLDDGPHLSYAFQWFFFSAGTVVVYALILRRRLRDQSQPTTTLASLAETLALLAIRLRGRGTAAEVRAAAVELAGGTDPTLDEAVDNAVAEGLVRVRGNELRHSLTRAGEARLAELLAAEAAEADEADGTALAETYERFLPINQRFLDTISIWQLDGDNGAPERIAALVEEVAPSLGWLSDRLPRFAGYRPRLERALERAREDPRWLDAPLIDSVHTVWFELHEHLLATVGRTRVSERSG